MAKRSCIGSGRISTPGSHAPWRPFRSWSSGTVCSPTHRASYPFRSLRLVCKILMPLLGLSVTNTIGYKKRTEMALEVVQQLEQEGHFPQAHYASDNGVLTLELTRCIESVGKHWGSELES